MSQAGGEIMMRIIGFLIGLVFSLAAAAQDAPPTARVAYVSPAPQQPHSGTIFEDDFSQPGDPANRYYEYHKQGTSFQWMPNDGYGGHGGAMKGQVEQGEVAAGTLTLDFGREPVAAHPRRGATVPERYWQ